MPHRVMFVCAMNVCRSPLMAFVFADALSTGSDPAGWTVTSRGTSVLREDPMCGVSASLIAGSEAGRVFIDAHASRPLVPDELDSQDVILVASRAERSKVAQLNPSLRSRTFTVREALALGSPPVTAAELDLMDRSQAPEGGTRLGGYTQLLHQRRGTVPVAAAPRRLPWSLRTPANPADIPDVHHKNQPKHLGMLKAVQGDVRNLHDQLRGYMAARSGV